MPMDRVILSLAQLNVLQAKLLESGFCRIVIENTNIENTLAVQLDGKMYLVNEQGLTQPLYAS